MPNYLAHQLDPETIHITVDVPFLDSLEDLVQLAMDLSRKNKVVTIHHDTDHRLKPGLLVDLAGEPIVEAGVDPYDHFEVIGYRDYEPDFFEKAYFTCPRDADATWEAQHGKPRPFPSMQVKPGGVLVISKPSLCDECVFGLSRAMSGGCAGKQYTPLPSVIS